MSQEIISTEREQQVIENAAKVTKRLEGDEVIIEIRVPAYIYSDHKDWNKHNVGSGSTISI